jgi:hypothetical protein
VNEESSLDAVRWAVIGGLVLGMLGYVGLLIEPPYRKDYYMMLTSFVLLIVVVVGTSPT